MQLLSPRSPDGSFTFAIVNTGDGLGEYHFEKFQSPTMAGGGRGDGSDLFNMHVIDRCIVIFNMHVRSLYC